MCFITHFKIKKATKILKRVLIFDRRDSLLNNENFRLKLIRSCWIFLNAENDALINPFNNNKNNINKNNINKNNNYNYNNNNYHNYNDDSNNNDNNNNDNNNIVIIIIIIALINPVLQQNRKYTQTNGEMGNICNTFLIYQRALVWHQRWSSQHFIITERYAYLPLLT